MQDIKDDPDTIGGDMRRYIRHPVSVPVEFRMADEPALPGNRGDDTFTMRDISRGGVSFTSTYPIQAGSVVFVIVPAVDSYKGIRGVVAWCRGANSRYDIGVTFADEENSFRMRMIEQVCRIEHYRKIMEQRRGTPVSSDEAAREWIEKFASCFPDLT